MQKILNETLVTNMQYANKCNTSDAATVKLQQRKIILKTDTIKPHLMS